MDIESKILRIFCENFTVRTHKKFPFVFAMGRNEIYELYTYVSGYSIPFRSHIEMIVTLNCKSS